MISVISTEASIFRSFGWVQDPSNFRNLCNVVAVFDENSIVHQTLRNEVLPTLVSKEDGLEELIQCLDQRPLRIAYTKLVGTTTIPRSQSRCNAIIQAAVKGQGRDFIGDWPADNFVRWAHAFGFLKYYYNEDAFEITEAGRQLVAVRSKDLIFPSDSKEENLSNQEIEELTKAVLAYPPAVRILSLLADEQAHLTKFEIGRQLGFIGEGGFTSLPQNLLLKALATAETTAERSKMRMDWDGSSDKYARMIGKWLTKLKLVTQEPKYFEVNTGKEIKKEMIGQAFRITAKGYSALVQSVGNSKHKRSAKNVCFEMLSLKGSDRELLRMRRAYILKYLQDARSRVILEDIHQYLRVHKIETSFQTIQDDIEGMNNIGISIEVTKEGLELVDELNDFIIPVAKLTKKTGMEQVKEELRKELKHVSHEYLSLLDLAYDSKQNRLFEMKTMQLLIEECGFFGSHLGGSRKPDGILYTMNLDDNYGIVLDTKAYTNGYNLPLSDADEMERYLKENEERNPILNPNEWWENFPKDVNKYHYLFVAGHFRGNYQAQLERIALLGKGDGAAINIVNLLRLAELIKSNMISLKKLDKILFCNEEFDPTTKCS